MTEIDPIADAIRQRETSKMLGDPQSPLPMGDDCRDSVDRLLEIAGWAPFHRPAHTSHRREPASSFVVEPWRVFALDAPSCRRLLAEVADWPERAGKIANMLAAADALLLFTWLPDPPADGDNAGRETVHDTDHDTGHGASRGLFAATEENMEHIAAASAAIQNFLVAATAEGRRTYWSSGGVLRGEHCFAHLGIPQNQILLGAVFLFPSDPAGPVDIMPGKQRAARGGIKAWRRWVG